MSRRSRLIWLTSACGVLFLAVVSMAAWRWQSRDETYRPGEEIDGITAELARGLPADHPRVTFTDVTSQARIAFRHFNGSRTSQLPEDMGSGAAWGDYDADGNIDLLVVNAGGPLTMSDDARQKSPARTTLYRNNGDGTFADVTDRAGVGLRAMGQGAAWADYDNDGRLDVVITTYGTNVLYRNNGDGTFADVSERSRLRAHTGFWTGASWGDYDRDGWLDLYVTGYVKYVKLETGRLRHDPENPASINPSSFRPERNLLFRNNRNGTFTEVAARAGVLDTTGRGMAAAWADLDEDGWLDLYVANDQSDNVLFRNRGNGTFENISHAARVADYRSAMGIAVGDWNGDGAQDLFLTHWIAQENALYTSLLKLAPRAAARPAALRFIDDADRYGLGQASLDFVGWATSFVDYDNDGRLDLFIVNGSTLQDRTDSTRLVPMRNQLFWNRSNGDGFYDVSVAAGSVFGQEHVGRGGAFADYDNDGDVDVFVVNHGGPGMLLRNDGGNRNGWIQVEARGEKANRQGIGATIRVVAGGTTQMRQVGAQASYLSQNSLIETFGLGATTRVDTIDVSWPGGGRDVVTGIGANQRIRIIQDRGLDTASARREDGSTANDRAAVQEFWRLLREAHAHRVARRDAEAMQAYARALTINPRHEDALYYLGSLRLEAGDYQGAVDAWRLLLAANSASARAHSRLGEVYACPDAGAPLRLDSAAMHFRTAHEINKEENGPLLRLAEVALLDGDRATARTYVTLVLKTHADNATALVYRNYLDSRVEAVARAAASPGPKHVSGEGDTKAGPGKAGVVTERCSALRSIVQRVLGAATPEGVRDAHRSLDSLVRSVRERR
jgi:hypothetical protein